MRAEEEEEEGEEGGREQRPRGSDRDIPIRRRENTLDRVKRVLGWSSVPSTPNPMRDNRDDITMNFLIPHPTVSRKEFLSRKGQNEV